MSNQMNQSVYADIAAVTEPHMAALILLDNSGSMNGKALNELVQGYNNFLSQSSLDELAMKRVDIAVVRFGDTVETVQDFIPLSRAVESPNLNLTASGKTPMGEAIEKGIQMLRDRCRLYDEAGIPHYKPWIFMITDGVPTDSIENAKTLIRQREDTGRLKFFSVAVNGADTNMLSSLGKRVIEATKEDDFKSIFNWFSKSMSIISASRVDENPQLPDLPEDFRVVPSDW